MPFGRQMLAIRPDAALVLMTGFSASLTLDQVKARGFRDLVHKPVTLASLADVVGHVDRAGRPKGES